MLLAANIAVEQEVIVASIRIALFIFTRFWYTPAHVQSKPSSKFALRQGFSNYGSQPHLGLRNKLAWQTRYKRFCKLMGRLHVSMTSRLSINGPPRKNFLKIGSQNKKVLRCPTLRHRLPK